MSDPGTWAARAVWAVLPLAGGPLLASALDPTADGIRGVASGLAWAGWAVGFGALLVPRTLSLTVVRTVAPGAPVAASWAALALPDGTAAWKPLLGLAATIVAAAVALSPFVADTFVNGSAYGSERRMALRLPGPLLVLAPVSWVVVAAGLTAGPLLLGARQWLAGGLALLVGVPAGLVAVRALHGLARRWVVFVPAGMVLHDPFGLPDAVLFPRRMVRRLGPAPLGVEALDCTQRAPGLALLLELSEPLPIGVRDGRSEVGSVDTDRLVFTPSRPGAVLDEARHRRIPVGPTPS